MTEVAPPEARPRESLETKGRKMFITAATAYGTSLVMQGAYISLLCRKDGVMPSRVGEAVVGDPDQIEMIRQSAETRHENIEKGPQQVDFIRARNFGKLPTTLRSGF